MKVLVDTCIIIDALQSRVPFAEVAQKIFIHSANKHFEGYLETEIIRGRKRTEQNQSPAKVTVILQLIFIDFSNAYTFPRINIF